MYLGNSFIAIEILLLSYKPLPLAMLYLFHLLLETLDPLDVSNKDELLLTKVPFNLTVGPLMLLLGANFLLNFLPVVKDYASV
jgi:hypothetical protein